jgi:hypothetical protein
MSSFSNLSLYLTERGEPGLGERAGELRPVRGEEIKRWWRAGTRRV